MANTIQSGIFRPEMLEPMGIPKNVRVLGWGMSCERPTMIKYVLPLAREVDDPTDAC
jgi:phenylalanyl-tRNA synthetase alpha chain